MYLVHIFIDISQDNTTQGNYFINNIVAQSSPISVRNPHTRIILGTCRNISLGSILLIFILILTQIFIFFRVVRIRFVFIKVFVVFELIQSGFNRGYQLSEKRFPKLQLKPFLPLFTTYLCSILFSLSAICKTPVRSPF